MSDSVIQKAVKAAARKARIHRPVSVHTLRHCFATHLLLNGVDIRQIQEYMGHANVETTIDLLARGQGAPKPCAKPARHHPDAHGAVTEAGRDSHVNTPYAPDDHPAFGSAPWYYVRWPRLPPTGSTRSPGVPWGHLLPPPQTDSGHPTRREKKSATLWPVGAAFDSWSIRFCLVPHRSATDPRGHETGYIIAAARAQRSAVHWCDKPVV